MNAAGIGPGPGLAAWEGAEKRSPEGKLSGRTGSWPGRALKAEKGQDSAAPGRPQPRRLYKWRQPVRAGCPGGGDQVAGVSGAGPGVGSSRRTQVGWGLGGGSSLESDVRAPGARSSAPPPATPGAWETVGRLRRSGARSPPAPLLRAGPERRGKEQRAAWDSPLPVPTPRPPAPSACAPGTARGRWPRVRPALLQTRSRGPWGHPQHSPMVSGPLSINCWGPQIQGLGRAGGWGLFYK